MDPSAITLEVLPAGNGDCLLLACPLGDRTWRMLINAGPDERWPSLRDRLAEIPRDADGKRHIDRAVISHIDHDALEMGRLDAALAPDLSQIYPKKGH